jgi:hypothetical protein
MVAKVVLLFAMTVALGRASGVCVQSLAGCGIGTLSRQPPQSVQCYIELIMGATISEDCCFYAASGELLPVSRALESLYWYHAQDLAAYADVLCGNSTEASGPLVDVPTTTTGGATQTGCVCASGNSLCQMLATPLCLSCCFQDSIGSGISSGGSTGLGILSQESIGAGISSRVGRQQQSQTCLACSTARKVEATARQRGELAV